GRHDGRGPLRSRLRIGVLLGPSSRTPWGMEWGQGGEAAGSGCPRRAMAEEKVSVLSRGRPALVKKEPLAASRHLRDESDGPSVPSSPIFRARFSAALPYPFQRSPQHPFRETGPRGGRSAVLVRGASPAPEPGPVRPLPQGGPPMRPLT